MSVICKEHWNELLYATLIHCIRRISKGFSRHEHRAAKACLHYLLNQGQKNEWVYVDIWISHCSHSCVFSMNYWRYTYLTIYRVAFFLSFPHPQISAVLLVKIALIQIFNSAWCNFKKSYTTQ